MALPQQSLLVRNPFWNARHLGLNLQGLQHMCFSKEKTCKFKHAVVAVSAFQSHSLEMSGKTPDGITLLVVVRDNGVILVCS